MKKKWIIIIVFGVLFTILSFIGYDHGYEAKYKKISGIYVEQEVEKSFGIKKYSIIEEAELPGARKGMLNIWWDRVGNTVLDASDAVFYSAGFVTGLKEGKFGIAVQYLVNIFYSLVDIVYNILLLCSLPGEIILILARIPIIGDAVEWCIGSIIEDFGDILGEFILILLIIYLNKLFFKFISKKKTGKANVLNTNDNKLKKINTKNNVNGINFINKLKHTFTKIGKFIINKKLYFIICAVLLTIIILTVKFVQSNNNNYVTGTEISKNSKCNIDCIINNGFKFYEKGDYYEAKQSFDNAFGERKYGNNGTINSDMVLKIIQTINDIYTISGFNETSDGSYSGDVSTEVYFDSINYGNYLIDIILNSNDIGLQEKSYDLLLSLSNTVMEFDFMSSRRIYFNILDSLNGSIPANYRLKIYEGIIISDAYGVNNVSTSENDKKSYYSEMETSAAYALLLDDSLPGLYYFKGIAEYNQGKCDDTIIDLETYLKMGSDTGRLIDTYIKLGMCYYAEGHFIEEESMYINKEASTFFEKSENMFKHIIDIEKTGEAYRYLGAMCIKKVNNKEIYNNDDYETCCNYRKEGMTLGLDTDGTIYNRYSTYCKKIDRYSFQHIDF